MRIVLVTYGSLGDLHPFIALARGLQGHGHDVALATSEPYRAKITALGLPFLPVRPDLSLHDQALVRRVMDGVAGSRFLMRSLVYPSVRDMHVDLSRIAANADLFVTSELVCAMPTVAEQTGVRWAFCALSPVSFLGSHDPSVLPGPVILHALQKLGPVMNRVILRMARAVSYSWWRPVRILRREVGLSAGPSPLFEGKFSPHLNLAGFSSVMQPPQPDWPPHTVQPGFLFHDEEQSSPQLPPHIARFLDSGETPIVFTLGSAAVRLAGDFYVQSARAAAQLGRRAVLLLGQNPAPPDLPSSILACDYLPYGRIFPRAAAVVHQGGVGTTGQALRAGCPMLVVPFAHDQFDNAARIVRLGVARQIARTRYSASTAGRELARLLEDAEVRRNAARLGERVRAERGVERACDALEELLVVPFSGGIRRGLVGDKTKPSA